MLYFSGAIMLELFIGLFEKFQTLIVGLLGFAGVIYTIRMNAHLARQQHERELSESRAALRTALIAELKAIRQSYKDRSSALREKEDGQSALIPEFATNQIYSQLIDRLGLLSAEETESVMNAYLLIAELPVRLKLLSQKKNESSEHSGYISISGDYTEIAAKIHDSFLPKFNNAIEIIQRNLG